MTAWAALRERGARLRDAAGRDIHSLAHPDTKTRRRLLAVGVVFAALYFGLHRRATQNTSKRS